MYHISRLCCAFWHHAGHIPSSWFCDRLPQLVTCGFSMVWPRPGNVDLSDPRASAIPPAAWLKTSILSPHGCTTTCTAQAQLRLYCGTAPKGTPQMQSATTHTGWWYTYPSEKWWSSSVGIMTFPIYGKIKWMFQTTNQTIIYRLPSHGFRRSDSPFKHCPPRSMKFVPVFVGQPKYGLHNKCHWHKRNLPRV